MNEETTILPVADKPSSRQSVVSIIALVAIAVIIVVALFARIATLTPKPTQLSAVTSNGLATATSLAQATTTSGQSNTVPTGNVVNAATPQTTAIIPGYPDPRLDTAQEQQLRTNYGGTHNKFIMVSLAGQFMQAIENGKVVRWSYVTTGKAGLDTPTGNFAVFTKESPLTFIPGSTNPASPFFGYPSKVQYGMEFLDGGYYLHDTWWRTVYGPGLTQWHYDPGRDEYSDGSHGCVNTPLDMMAWLFTWTPMGTPVIVF